MKLEDFKKLKTGDNVIVYGNKAVIVKVEKETALVRIGKTQETVYITEIECKI